MSAPTTRETLLSLLFGGATSSAASVVPVLREFERGHPLTPSQRAHTLLRMDAGFGTDANVEEVLARGYQLLVKGYSASRAAAHARRVSKWIELRRDDTWATWSPKPLLLSRPSRTVVLRQATRTRYRYALLLTTMTELSLEEIVSLYQDRGQIEVEIQSDKMGLLIARRRKRSFAAQGLLILVNDWVHNLLALLHATIFVDTRFADFGPKRLIRDVLSIPGKATFNEGGLVAVQLSADHPYADDLVACLARLPTPWSATLCNNAHSS